MFTSDLFLIFCRLIKLECIFTSHKIPLAYYNNTFQLLTSVLVALLYTIICDVNFISILRGGETQQYQSGKASNTWRLISSQLNYLRFLKSNGVCDSL